ncbi:cytosolic phospholipase A2 gamma-like [Engraulis encrasicolus]|uniref:cytosolic phospholipase A2 gamma-like n=1 Tax=Engraulis encrasicolus TaxID=184585 RepID=UPI002FD3A53C
MDVFIRRHDLSPAEENCIKERQSRVKQALQRHGIPETHVPRVALLGSGGGERASVALLGVVRELAMGDLLDCFLYMVGVSGSTWCMASLYEDSKWSQRAAKVISRALMNMSEGEGVTFSEAVQWLKKRDEEGDLSLTDFWAVLASKIKGEHLETRLLQGDEGDGTNPYPLYSANEMACYEKEHKNKTVASLVPLTGAKNAKENRIIS